MGDGMAKAPLTKKTVRKTEQKSFIPSPEEQQREDG